MNINSETVTDIATKAGPPVTVSGLTLFGFQVPELIQLLTVAYIVLIIIDKIWVMVKRWKNK